MQFLWNLLHSLPLNGVTVGIISFSPLIPIVASIYRSHDDSPGALRTRAVMHSLFIVGVSVSIYIYAIWLAVSWTKETLWQLILSHYAFY